MTHREALEILAVNRAHRLVVATMGSVGIWPSISDSTADFSYLPSSMGQGVPLGLGLAMTHPEGVVVVTGDGSLLMNLGCLVTVANHPAPLTILLIDNGLYEVTGGQTVVGAGTTDFAGLARAAGIARVFAFADLESWREGSKYVFAQSSPSFVWLKVVGEIGKKTPAPPRPMAEQIARLRTLGPYNPR